MVRIGINCGHTVSGQPGCGAVGRIDESVETRSVGKELIRLFKDGGHAVYDCTNDYASTTSENLAAIVAMAEKQPLDLFVSIHFNAGGGRGTEVYTYLGEALDEAVNVCEGIAALGFGNRGVKDGRGLYVIRRTSARAMLIEVCFVDTDDADKYKSVGYQKIAASIYRAITGENAADDTNAAAIVNELKALGIITDAALWTGYCENDAHVYWFCRKLRDYTRDKAKGETAGNEYGEINDIAWDLNYRGVISDMMLWEDYMRRDANVYWLLRKGLHWCRTH